jgi:alkylation response protein AidB-like acyl-CoA dehydrogenase
MTLVLTEEQQALADMARDFVDREAPVSRFRRSRDASRGDPGLWAQIRELGWHAILVPERHGGLGLGLPELAVVLEAVGRNLVGTPLVSAAACAAFLPGEIASGEVVALAWHERGARGRPHVAARWDDGRLSGEKVAVLDGGSASAFVVSARCAGEVGLFRVAARDATVRPLRRIDHHDAADVSFDRARAEPLAGDAAALQQALDHGAIAASAEMLGAMQAAFDKTIAWLKERVQFGVPIGSFQALQHRAVDLFVELELTRSVVMAAARDPSPSLASLAKARCSDTFLAIAKEGVQLHGGIGMTDEHDIGLFLKRAQVAAVTFGDASFHRERWASLNGY